MKNKKMRTVLLALLVLFVGITSGFGVYTLAKYISGSTATGTADVAKWVVKVNDTDITPAGSTSLGNVALTTIDNTNVVTGKIAPASSAYGVFTIDPTGTEVAVGYKFTLGAITASSGTVPTGLAVEKVEYCSGDSCDPASTNGWTAITASGSDYAGTINLPSASSAMTAAEKINVKVTIKWTDDETNGSDTADTVDDANHTAAGVTGATLSIPVETVVYQVEA